MSSGCVGEVRLLPMLSFIPLSVLREREKHGLRGGVVRRSPGNGALSLILGAEAAASPLLPAARIWFCLSMGRVSWQVW